MTRTDRLSTVPSWEKAKAQIQEKLNGNLPERERLEQFRQQDWWYTDGQYEDHGAPHQARVLVYVNEGLSALAKRDIVFPDIIQKALLWTAVTHDTQVKRGHYKTHGLDAARWVGVHLGEAMDRETRFLTQYYCMNHGLEDKYLIGQNYVYDQDLIMVDTGLKLLKDADAVDRVRFSKYSPDYLNENFLRLSITKEILLPTAQELFSRTKQKQLPCNQAFDLVFDAAVDMGIVK